MLRVHHHQHGYSHSDVNSGNREHFSCRISVLIVNKRKITRVTPLLLTQWHQLVVARGARQFAASDPPHRTSIRIKIRIFLFFFARVTFVPVKLS